MRQDGPDAVLREAVRTGRVQTREKLRSEYRRLLFQFHPDVAGGGEGATADFETHLLIDAYQTLLEQLDSGRSLNQPVDHLHLVAVIWRGMQADGRNRGELVQLLPVSTPSELRSGVLALFESHPAVSEKELSYDPVARSSHYAVKNTLRYVISGRRLYRTVGVSFAREAEHRQTAVGSGSANVFTYLLKVLNTDVVLLG